MERGKFEESKMEHGYPEGLGIQVGGNAYTPAGQVLEGQYHYNPEAVPEPDATYMPIACMQCEKPSCVKVCPVRTTYREADGPVVIDYNWCIGCRMCMSACPYWARRFNLTDPVLPKEEMNPNTHYLGNRPRMQPDPQSQYQHARGIATARRESGGAGLHQPGPDADEPRNSMLQLHRWLRRVGTRYPGQTGIAETVRKDVSE
jgi:Fe-S-cluster-containing hydrogenase component 2